jgi:hypothetical protein
VAKVFTWDADHLQNFVYEQRKRAADLQFLPPKSWGTVDPHTLLGPAKQSEASQPPTPAKPEKPAVKSKEKKPLTLLPHIK